MKKFQILKVISFFYNKRLPTILSIFFQNNLSPSLYNPRRFQKLILPKWEKFEEYFMRNEGKQVYLVTVCQELFHKKIIWINYVLFLLRLDFLWLAKYRVLNILHNDHLSTPYIIRLNFPVASFKLLRIFRLFPSNRINKWKENLIYNLSTFHKVFFSYVLFLILI